MKFLELSQSLSLRNQSLRAVVICTFALSGCADFGLGQEEYSCSGLPEGVRCQSAREVYLARSAYIEAYARNRGTRLNPYLAPASLWGQNSNPQVEGWESFGFWGQIPTYEDLSSRDLRTFCAPQDVLIVDMSPYIELDGTGHSGELQLKKLPYQGCRAYDVGAGLNLLNIRRAVSLGSVSASLANSLHERYLPVPYIDQAPQGPQRSQSKGSSMGATDPKVSR